MKTFIVCLNTHAKWEVHVVLCDDATDAVVRAREQTHLSDLIVSTGVEEVHSHKVLPGGGWHSQVLAVRPGQVWQDDDTRLRVCSPRTFTILEIGSIYVGSGFRTHQVPAARVDHSPSGRRTWIQLSRFKPGKRGYKLIKDVPTGTICAGI